MMFLDEHSKSQLHSSLEVFTVNGTGGGDYMSGEIFTVKNLETNAIYWLVNYSQKPVINSTSVQNIHCA